MSAEASTNSSPSSSSGAVPPYPSKMARTDVGNSEVRAGSVGSGCSSADDDEDVEYCENSPWVFIPEPVFGKIFLALEPRDIMRAGQTCKRWNKLSRDEYIWRKYFQREFNVEASIGLKPGERTRRKTGRELKADGVT